jgi:hypothetical protein
MQPTHLHSTLMWLLFTQGHGQDEWSSVFQGPELYGLRVQVGDYELCNVSTECWILCVNIYEGYEILLLQ